MGHGEYMYKILKLNFHREVSDCKAKLSHKIPHDCTGFFDSLDNIIDSSSNSLGNIIETIDVSSWPKLSNSQNEARTYVDAVVSQMQRHLSSTNQMLKQFDKESSGDSLETETIANWIEQAHKMHWSQTLAVIGQCALRPLCYVVYYATQEVNRWDRWAIEKAENDIKANLITQLAKSKRSYNFLQKIKKMLRNSISRMRSLLLMIGEHRHGLSTVDEFAFNAQINWLKTLNSRIAKFEMQCFDLLQEVAQLRSLITSFTKIESIYPWHLEPPRITLDIEIDDDKMKVSSLPNDPSNLTENQSKDKTLHDIDTHEMMQNMGMDFVNNDARLSIDDAVEYAYSQISNEFTNPYFQSIWDLQLKTKILEEKGSVLSLKLQRRQLRHFEVFIQLVLENDNTMAESINSKLDDLEYEPGIFRLGVNFVNNILIL